MLDGKRIEQLVHRELEVEIFDEIDSTNAEAKRRALMHGATEKMSPMLLIARSQTAGRGRMGRSFHSPEGGGIFMSLLYFTDKPLLDAVSVTTAAAAIVAEEIERVTSAQMKIKWVNDVYNDRGKVSGILVETVPVSEKIRAMIVGIGINTGEDDFPTELSGIASSIGDIRGRENALVAAIAEGLLAHADSPTDKGYMEEYRKRFMLLGERVSLLSCGEKLDEGVVVGVDDDGGLIYIPDGKNEKVTVRTGEVSVRKAKIDE